MATHSVVDQLLEIIGKARWPSSHRTGGQTRRTYERGLDQVNAYRGHPGVFVQALQTFQATQSCAYAYAGIAFALVVASSSSGDEIHRRGFDEAMKWLEKAQEWEPNRVEINFVEAAFYLNSGQEKNARLVLDYLCQQQPQNYYLCLMEMNYWQKQQDMVRYTDWAEQGRKAADNPLRQAYILNALAGLYLDQGKYRQSIRLYRDVVRLDPSDPWAWHNMSVMFVRMKRFEEAEMCNQRALSIMDFGAARDVEETIKNNRPGGLSRLFGR